MVYCSARVHIRLLNKQVFIRIECVEIENGMSQMRSRYVEISVGLHLLCRFDVERCLVDRLISRTVVLCSVRSVFSICGTSVPVTIS